MASTRSSETPKLLSLQGTRSGGVCLMKCTHEITALPLFLFSFLLMVIVSRAYILPQLFYCARYIRICFSFLRFFLCIQGLLEFICRIVRARPVALIDLHGHSRRFNVFLWVGSILLFFFLRRCCFYASSRRWRNPFSPAPGTAVTLLRAGSNRSERRQVLATPR